ncbi:hypothetical protein D7X88_15210 [bacterium C-53]|nr:hypothetical protein [Lachnospiraceae bacterium]RKJ08410.1 hypothetical protein D7X88_15210 [bacterium C-53]
MQKTAKESDNIYDCLVFDFKQINSNLTLKKYVTPMIFLRDLIWKDSYGGRKYTDVGFGTNENDLGGPIVSFYMEKWGNFLPNLDVALNTRDGVLEFSVNDVSKLEVAVSSAITQVVVWYYIRV